ncbi:MAG TPA: alpha/beta hydrolase [Longimicrobium sp.]|nr:alpha/beta hydrolase [Longimicrobium sp.]
MSSIRRSVLAATLAATATFPLAAQEPRLLGPDEVMQLPSGTVEHRGAYGRDSMQFGELRLPPGRGPFPVAVVVHGGCFDARATLRVNAPLADALRREGIATWNVEYRSIEHPGGGWPGTFTDVGAALDHVRELARRFPLDTARVVAVGHSAGAPLAGWAALRDRVPEGSPVRSADAPLRLRGAVALGGPLELAPLIGHDELICGAPVITRLMGGGPSEVASHYSAVTPTSLARPGTRVRLISGEFDPVVPDGSARTSVEQMRAAGADAEYRRLAGAGHFEVIAPGSDAWPAVLEAVRTVLASP